jgi:UDP-N-acetylglucosamine:LPS N-acetylglucosamine transferase
MPAQLTTPQLPPLLTTPPVAPAADPGVIGGRPRVLVVSGSVGAGHDGAANELAARLVAAGAEVAVRDFLDAVPRPVASLLRDGYTNSVMHVPYAFEFLFRRTEHRGLLWGIQQAVCAVAETAVTRWVTDVRPDVVVATYPLAAQTVGRLRVSGRLGVPAMTYLTDPAVHVSWLHPGIDVNLTVTAATAAQGAAEYGHRFTVGGPLVPSRFGVPLELDRLVDLRRDLGLSAGRPVALLVAGSLGLGDVLPTVRDVGAAGFTPLVLCGRNDTLRRRVATEWGAVALGWRTDVHELMQVADVLVHNAGGLSCTEALVAGLPTVTYRPIPGHGRANARVLHEAGLAPWARTPAELARCLRAESGRDRTPGPLADPTDVVLAALHRTAARAA